MAFEPPFTREASCSFGLFPSSVRWFAGIRKGDYIVSANGIKLDDVSTMDAVLKACNGEKITLGVQRDGTNFEVMITPVKSIEDQKYRLGLWMRDSAAGLGTVTYVDTRDNHYMALGHAICDGDSGKVLAVGNGRIVDCTISSVQKGTKGNAGELKGSFGVGAQVLGTIEENTQFGRSEERRVGKECRSRWSPYH